MTKEKEPNMDRQLGDDGEEEWFCEHGVGHPIGPFPKGQEYRGIHTCCGYKRCHDKLKLIFGQ